MKNVLVVYATMSGNTEEIAELIEKGLVSEGCTVEKVEADDTTAEMISNYDAFLLGSFTWGDGDLPEESMDLYDELEAADLTGKSFAVFGSGDTSYEIFCGAVDELETIVKEQGGELVLDGLKIEDFPEGEEVNETIEYGAKFARIVKEKPS
ncbi:flavodoxin [Salisediminibacterium halotolerans]|uniref:Flavodoxin n=1 Tax=Salisediminibacterium halotolerans TaxID=517425 RepID=A0A1H9WAY7_9BACI|nr:flavodoxin [Salisediminibacterium haloalkalitolerans]SES30633.1 flavodoxin I [Salisediminibacterium haloalkalitolerans]